MSSRRELGVDPSQEEIRSYIKMEQVRFGFSSFICALTETVVVAAVVAGLGLGLGDWGLWIAAAVLITLVGGFWRFGISRHLAASWISAATHEITSRNELKSQAAKREFETSLGQALEMAETEPEIYDIVSLALSSTLGDAPAEVLLADNSHAHLSRVVVNPDGGESPGCRVDSPEHCPAARRSSTQRFADSDAIEACPKLRGRPGGRCSAVCVPVSIMGRTVGVIHTIGEPGQLDDELTLERLQTLANQGGTRLGVIRMMADTQMQAERDSLTGLINRRTLENKVHNLRDEVSVFSVSMVDLDHFKHLNDTYGHETGDRALRLFAHTAREVLRDHDLICRYGGEEFTIVLPSCRAGDARQALEDVRAALVPALQAAGLPTFTASFGVVEANENEDLDTIIKRADAALFDAKHAGRDCIVVHDGEGNTLEVPARAKRGSPRVRGGNAPVATNGVTDAVTAS